MEEVFLRTSIPQNEGSIEQVFDRRQILLMDMEENICTSHLHMLNCKRGR